MLDAISLADRLADAARAAVLNERTALEHPAGGVRGVTIELTVTGAGQLDEATAYVERRSKGPALLARRTGPGSAH